MATNVLSLPSERVRALAGTQARGKILTVYLDVGGTPELSLLPARLTLIESLLDRARREADGLELDDEQRKAFDADVERVRDYLSDADPEGAPGFAIFASQLDDLFEVVRLPRSVASDVCVGDAPVVEPLTRMGSDRWCIALVNRSTARIFTGSAHGLRELGEIEDEVHGQHKQGGWSQARFERSVEHEVDEHLDGVADNLQALDRVAPFDWLVVGTQSETMPRIEEALSEPLRRKLAGRIDIDVENAGVDDIVEAAEPLVAEMRARREIEDLDRLAQGLGGSSAACAGLGETLKALNERRVELLLYQEGFEAAGAVCPACGILAEGRVTRCPIDEQQMRALENILEAAIAAALAQAADVRSVANGAGLSDHGRIGAVLRF